MKTRYIHLLILLFITIAKSAAMPIPAELKPILVQHNPQQIDVAALLALNHQRYRQDIYYGMDIHLQDANQNEYQRRLRSKTNFTLRASCKGVKVPR